MNNMRIFAVSIAAFIIVNTFTRCDDNLYVPQAPIEVTSIVLDEEYKDGMEAVIGNNFLIAGLVTVYPNEATSKTEHFASSEPDVATVDESGNVVAREVGTTVLSITVDKHTVEFDLTVISRIAYDVTDIEISQDNFELDVSQTVDLFGKIRPTPVEAEYPDIIFSSSNLSVATIDETGLITCVGAGESIVTAKSKADASVSASVTVKGFTIQPGFTIVNGVVTAYSGVGGDIRIPGAAVSVATGVFRRNTAVTSVHLNNVEELGNEAFRESPNLIRVIAPNLKTIRNSVFQDCIKLEMIEMEKLEIIQQFAFHNTNLKSLYLPSLKVITDRKRQFGECKQLVTVDMPALEVLGTSEAFFGCKALKNINMPKLNTFAGGTNTGNGQSNFSGCEALEKVSFPSLNNLYENTFSGCTNLKVLDLSLAMTFNLVKNQNAVPDQTQLTIYVPTEDVKNLFTGQAYTVKVGSPAP